MMIPIDPSSLFYLGIALLFLFSFLKLIADRQKGKRFEVMSAIFGLGQTVGVTALVAALILFVLISVTHGNPSEKTLEQLNASIHRLNAWLERSWMVFVPILLAVAASIAHVSLETTRLRTKMLGYAIRLTSTTKLIVGIMACSSFVSIGTVSFAQQQLENAQSAAEENRQAQLVLFKEVQRLVVAEAAKQIVQEASPDNPSVLSTHAAYDIAASYLPYKIRHKRPALFAPRTKEAAAIATGDVSLADIQGMQAHVEEKLSSEGKLVDDLVDVTYDKFVSDSINDLVLHIDNPVLSELLGIFSDTVYANKLKEFARQQVEKLFHSNLSIHAIDQIHSSAATFGHALTGHTFHDPVLTTSPSSPSLGDPRWDQVRAQVSHDAEQANLFHGAEGPVTAKYAISHFNQFWQATGLILATAKNRNDIAESAFGNYLLENEEYAALWSFEMKGRLPSEYAGDLEKLSLSGTQHEMEFIEYAAKGAKGGDAAAKSALESMGLTVDDIGKLSAEEIGEKVYKRWGAFPADRYALYFQETKPDEVNRAYDYFDSDPVRNRFVSLGGIRSTDDSHPVDFRSVEDAAHAEYKREHPAYISEAEREAGENKPVEVHRAIP